MKGERKLLVSYGSGLRDGAPLSTQLLVERLQESLSCQFCVRREIRGGTEAGLSLRTGKAPGATVLYANPGEGGVPLRIRGPASTDTKT